MMKQDPRPESEEITRVLGLDETGGMAKRVRRLPWIGLAVLAAVLAVSLWGFSGDNPTLTYKTAKARQGDLTVTVGATGNLEPTNQVDVGSERSGIVKTVEVDYNSQVEVGQVLARLDTALLEAEGRMYVAALESAEAGVLQARATLRETGAELERMKRAHELTGGRVPAARELDAAEAAVARARADEAAARAQVSQAQANLDANRTDLSKTLIRSPINGIVLSRSVEPGQTVAASLQAPVLFTLAEDLTRMELHVDLDEADVGKVEQGQQASFTVDAYPGRIFPAQITQVRYSANNEEGVVTYETVLKVDNTSLLLRPGMTATADIVVSRVKDTVLVPNGALRFVPGTPKEAVEEKNGSMVSKIMPGPPRRSSNASADQRSGGRASAEQQVWVLKEGSPVPVDVVVGETDGLMTEIVSGDVRPGMDLIIGTMDTGR